MTGTFGTRRAKNEIGSYEYRLEKIKRWFPVRFWLSETMPNKIQLWYRIYWVDPKWWIIHRTIDRYNIIKIKSLKPGYYDYDTRLFHACFDLLVEYVEEAGGQMDSDREMPLNYLEQGFSPAVARGLAYFDWCISDCPGHQADNAKVAKNLYLWWNVERANRQEPFGMETIWKEWREDEGSSMRVGIPHRLAGELKEFYDAEDNEKLAQLIAIRSSMWT